MIHSPADLLLTRMGLRFANRLFPVTIGRAGITTDKQEGDMATPAGEHEIVGMLYRPDRVDAACLPRWARPIRPFDLWCDDPEHYDYNQMVSAPFDASHEVLRRTDPMYDLVLITDWNWPDAEPGAGSAIFLHAWRRPGYPTAGCIGLRADHLLWIAGRLREGSRLIVRP